MHRQRLVAISIVPSVEVAAACLMRSRNDTGDSLLLPDRTAKLRFARKELAEVSSVRARHGTVRGAAWHSRLHPPRPMRDA
jgi:hypothetical protein